MKVSIVNARDGKASSELEVSEKNFGAEFNESLVHQVVVAYQAAARLGTRKQKTRTEVRGGGKKPFAQKGGGRARAGTIRSPLWRGGGKVFPSSPDENFVQKVNRKMYRGAVRAILSELVRQQRLVAVDDLAVAQPKTKVLLETLTRFGTKDVLIVTENVDQNLYLAARNLYRVDVRDATAVDPVSLVAHEKVIMSVGALKKFEEMLA